MHIVGSGWIVEIDIFNKPPGKSDVQFQKHWLGH